MQRLRILYQDAFIVVFEKPAGVEVHPPESRIRAGLPRSKKADVIRILRNQMGVPVFPVHRLDRATHGVMVMALDGRSAGILQSQFKSGEIEKSYLLMCRGWTEDAGRIKEPLSSDSDETLLKDAVTDFETLFRFELPIASKNHSTSRFSLVQAFPRTGRFHQIRRHFKKMAHPLIGDSVYGDGRQNRIWREMLSEQKLFLMAWSLRFQHPVSGEKLSYRSRFSKGWHPVFDRVGFCPLRS